MGSRRIGLGRMETLVENLKRELALGGSVLVGMKRKTKAHTTSHTIRVADSGRVLTNRGASGTVTFTLPAPDSDFDGVDFYTLSHATQVITVATATADTLVTVNDVAADSISSENKAGAWMHVYCDGTQWYAEPRTDGITYTIVTA